MGISRRTSVSLLFGLCAVGCADKPAPPATEEPLAAAARPAAPSLTPEGDAQRTRVVEDSVNDHVDRTSRIIAQREQAKRDAADLRELRAGREAEASAKGEPAKGEPTKRIASPSPDEESEDVESLAAALRAGRAIDVARPVAEPVAETPAGPVARASLPALPRGSAGGEASGAIDTPTSLEVTRKPAEVTPSARDDEPRPDVTRAAIVDPFVAVAGRFVDRVADDPRDLAAQLELQLVRYLKGDPVPAMSDLAALPVEDREMLAAVCDALTNFRSLVRSNANPLASAKAQPWVEMTDRIRARSDLTLSGLTLCERVSAFGTYDEMSLDRLVAGEPRWCVLYCEVDGFLSQLDAQQRWATKLSLEVKLYDGRGLVVWTSAPEVFTDASRRRRRDFFIAKRVQLPGTLVGGNYLLKATVKDVQANRIDESSIQFTVAGKDPVP